MRPTTVTLAGLLAGVLLVTGCGGADGPPATGPAGAGPESAGSQAVANEQDEQFAAGMRGHHAQAVEMADMVLGSDAAPEVADLAQRIRAAQTAEIRELDAILAELGVEAGPKSGHGGHGGHGGDAPAHEEMMTDAQMQQLDDADGLQAQRLFLELMTEHHEGALVSAERQLAEGEHPRLRAIAQTILDTQRGEIAEMEQLRTQL